MLKGTTSTAADSVFLILPGGEERRAAASGELAYHVFEVMDAIAVSQCRPVPRSKADAHAGPLPLSFPDYLT